MLFERLKRDATQYAMVRAPKNVFHLWDTLGDIYLMRIGMFICRYEAYDYKLAII